ncbi:amidohydrolase [Candidatus Bathyarchaeota archaeon]|nr:amidohydrolase [Candidatus Bathyarchaeota archaeon]
MLSKVGIEVVDAHAHFFTASTLKAWSLRGRTREGFEQRTRSRTDMTSIELPDESTDVAQQWVDEMDRYGITAMGFMVGAEAYDDFLEAKTRFPERFMGYANINPGDPEAAEKVDKAAKDGLQGIKLYPSSWPDLHTYDAACYPVYEAALKHRFPVFLHFGITIGGQADLRHGNPLDIQVPSRDFPDLNFVIAHFGAGLFRELLLLQYQADNVYMDSSGSNSWMRYLPYDLDLRKIFERAITAGGAEKVIFGTDSTFFPRGFRVNILEQQYEAVRSLSEGPDAIVSVEDIYAIFRGNILGLNGFTPKKL